MVGARFRGPAFRAMNAAQRTRLAHQEDFVRSHGKNLPGHIGRRIAGQKDSQRGNFGGFHFLQTGHAVALLIWFLLQVLGAWSQIHGSGSVSNIAHLGGALVEGAEPALGYRHFQPRDISIGYIPARGPVMTNSKGMTIYTQARYSIMYGGRETRDGYRPDYRDGKAVGAKGCVDACLKTWTRVAAPANAQSSGYWEVLTRPDGSKQWAYKGVALYTNNADKKPGDIRGNNIHDVVYGEPGSKDDFSIAAGDGKGAGAGYYWRMVTFFTST